MDEDGNVIARMRAVTLSREYGSGGGEIAARLAKHLGWQLIDHEVVVQVAKRLGISIEEADAQDEHVEGLVSRVLTGLQIIQPLVPVVSPAPMAPFVNNYREAVERVIEGAVAAGQVVIVGRAGQVVLGSRRDVLHARIVASLTMRTEYVMRREGLDEGAARARIQLKDRDRLRYLQTEHGLNAADSHLYDLVINTSILDLDSAVELLTLALERKATRLARTTGELGPVIGLDRYPERPVDFRPPMGSSKATSA